MKQFGNTTHIRGIFRKLFMLNVRMLNSCHLATPEYIINKKLTTNQLFKKIFLKTLYSPVLFNSLRIICLGLLSITFITEITETTNNIFEIFRFDNVFWIMNINNINQTVQKPIGMPQLITSSVRILFGTRKNNLPRSL